MPDVMLKLGGQLGFTAPVMRFSLKQKCNTEAVKRFSLVKKCSIGFYNILLVISIDDEYDEEDDDDYERKDMGVRDMDAVN